MAVRMSRAEFKALQAGTAHFPPSNEGAKQEVPRKARASMPENQVEAQIVDFLRQRRWVVKRQHVGKHVPLGLLLRYLERGPITKELLFRNTVDVGEKYAADWRAERATAGHSRLMQVLYVEVKAPGKKPTREQEDWLKRARINGALAGWWDSLDSFMAWYKAEFGL